MPSADDHRAAARRLRRTADQLTHDASILAGAISPASVAGGPVRWALERGVDDVVTLVHRAASDLHRLAAACEHLAEARERTFLGDAVGLLRDRGLAAGIDTTSPRRAGP